MTAMDRPPLRLIQGELNDSPPPEIIHSDTDIDIRELISGEMYTALIDPATEQAVKHDAVKLQHVLFNNPSNSYVPIRIDLSRIDKDHEGLSVDNTGDEAIMIPGLIGLEGMDYVTEGVDDKVPIIRLYMGIMLSYRIAQAKLGAEKFFRTVMIKHFADHHKRGALTARKLGEIERDPQATRDKFRQNVASFAAGVALNSLFDDTEREAMLDVLEQRYEHEKHVEDSIADVAEHNLMIPASHMPKDNYTAEARGFASPLPFEEVTMILHGRLSKKRR